MHVNPSVCSCAFAREILKNNTDPKLQVYMVDIGAQDHPIPGAHQKNAIKSVVSFA